MKKIVKRLGKSVGINFTPEEMKIYGIDVGKIFDIELTEDRRKYANKRRK